MLAGDGMEAQQRISAHSRLALAVYWGDSCEKAVGAGKGAARIRIKRILGLRWLKGVYRAGFSFAKNSTAFDAAEMDERSCWSCPGFCRRRILPRR